jgi:hypothetical protein
MAALQPCVPLILTFQANNITSHSKRAVASATILAGGGIGGILSGTVFMSSESPHYTVCVPGVFLTDSANKETKTGVWFTFACSIVSICLIIILDVYLWRRNKAARAGLLVNEGMPGWMYTL